MICEGHNKCDKFVTQLQAIKQEVLREICYGPRMKLHEAKVYTFMLVIGCDMAFHGGVIVSNIHWFLVANSYCRLF
jgi:hypothetical protein